MCVDAILSSVSFLVLILYDLDAHDIRPYHVYLAKLRYPAVFVPQHRSYFTAECCPNQFGKRLPDNIDMCRCPRCLLVFLAQEHFEDMLFLKTLQLPLVIGIGVVVVSQICSARQSLANHTM